MKNIVDGPIFIERGRGACPYQVEGVITKSDANYPFYFRYRWDCAQFYIWEPGHAWSFNTRFQIFFRDQENVSGDGDGLLGYMEDGEAHAFIRRWAQEFLDGQHVSPDR